MRKEKLFKLLVFLVLFLIMVLFLMYLIINNEGKTISKEQLQEIEIYLTSTCFLNSVYSSPEEIRLDYILASSNQSQATTQNDDAEYLYLALMQNYNSEIESLYPEITNSLNLSESQKKAEIKNKHLAENAQRTLEYKKFSYDLIKQILIENIVIDDRFNRAIEKYK